MIHVYAECRTSSGRRVALQTPVDPALYEDIPTFTGWALATLTTVAARSGEGIDPTTFSHRRLTTLDLIGRS